MERVGCSMRICVIGAGVGGLAVAAGLVARGGDVTVFERHERSPLGGFGISLFGNGLRALDALGLGPRMDRVLSSPPPARGGLPDSDGRWLVRSSASMLDSTRVIERGRLGRALIEAVSDRIVWGEEMTERAALSDEGFDVVVAADGIRSRTRAGWPGDPGIRFAGYHAWRGVTSQAVRPGAPGEMWGRGKRFGMAPLDDGRVYWFATVNGREEEPPPATCQAVRAAFGD